MSDDRRTITLEEATKLYDKRNRRNNLILFTYAGVAVVAAVVEMDIQNRIGRETEKNINEAHIKKENTEYFRSSAARDKFFQLRDELWQINTTLTALKNENISKAERFSLAKYSGHTAHIFAGVVYDNGLFIKNKKEFIRDKAIDFNNFCWYNEEYVLKTWPNPKERNEAMESAQKSAYEKATKLAQGHTKSGDTTIAIDETTKIFEQKSKPTLTALNNEFVALNTNINDACTSYPREFMVRPVSSTLSNSAAAVDVFGIIALAFVGKALYDKAKKFSGGAQVYIKEHLSKMYEVMK